MDFCILRPLISVIVSLLFLLVTLCLIPQEQSPNANFDLKKNEKKIVKLEKAAIAHDDAGEYIFKQPREITPVPDGSFFVIDNYQVIKFDRDGDIKALIVRKGQGPGEATSLKQLVVRDDTLIVNTGVMGKLMLFDLDGKLKGEYTTRLNFQKTDKGISVGESTYTIIGSTRENQFLTIPYSLAKNVPDGTDFKLLPVTVMTEKGEIQKILFEIPIKAVNYKMSEGMYRSIQLMVRNLAFASNEDFIFFCNTERYEISKYSISQNRIVDILKRPYSPIRIPEEYKEKYSYGDLFYMSWKGKATSLKVPTPEYFHDIQRIYLVNNCIWVITSTIDRDKGVLIDTFEQKGDYITSFYMSYPGNVDLRSLYREPVCIVSGLLYIRETNSEGNYLITKYKILD